MSKKDGGSAFPRDWSSGHKGMTLRDYFAGQAVTLFPLTTEDLDAIVRGHSPDHAVVAKFCYGAADSMIAERDKEES